MAATKTVGTGNARFSCILRQAIKLTYAKKNINLSMLIILMFMIYFNKINIASSLKKNKCKNWGENSTNICRIGYPFLTKNILHVHFWLGNLQMNSSVHLLIS